MSIILARNHIETGFSMDDARLLKDYIDAVKVSSPENEKIIIDFEGVKFFTTQFFNSSIGKYVLEIGPSEFESKFEIINLSEVGQATFKHSYENAVSYFHLPPEKRLQQDDIVNQTEDV